MVVLREELARVQDVPQHHDEEHERGLEDVEEPLVSDDRGPRQRIRVSVAPDAIVAEVLDRTIDAADEDEEGRNVQTPDRDGYLAGDDAGATAADVEDQDHGQEEGDDHDLDDQRGFEQGGGDVQHCVAQVRVGGPGDAHAVEDFDDGGEQAEGGECATWVDGGAVGDVVQHAPEDVVVCQLKDWAESS